MSVRVIYSSKLKVAPHPKSPKQLPLNALLPDVLPYPLVMQIIAYKLALSQEQRINNGLLVKVI